MSSQKRQSIRVPHPSRFCEGRERLYSTLQQLLLPLPFLLIIPQRIYFCICRNEGKILKGANSATPADTQSLRRRRNSYACFGPARIKVLSEPQSLDRQQ
jgi:hypothetical protein